MRHAVRSLLKNRAVTLFAVVSLALGIGVNTLMFSVVDAVLLRPLPYPESARLVFAWFVPPNEPDQKRPATLAAYRALQEASSVFDHVGTIGGVDDTATFAANPLDPVEQIAGQRFSAEVPRALGATPLMGRWFTESEVAEGRSAIVISHQLWRTHFGGSNSVLGRGVRLDGAMATIIGVMPKGWMLFNYPAQFWVPYRIGAGERVLPLARLRAGIDSRQAQIEMNRLAGNLSDAFPATNKGWGIRLEPALEVYVGWVRQPLLIAQGVALLVLLIACANTAGLLLVQAKTKTREIALRVALGGSPWQIARQLLGECALLCLGATLFGVAIAFGGSKLFLLISPAWFPRAGEIGLHVRVLGATAAASALTVLLFGMIPGLLASRLDLAGAINDTGRGATATGATQRFRAVLVVLQVSAALTLLTGAGLMTNSFFRLYNDATGCDTRNVITFQLRFPPGRFTTAAAFSQADAAFERIRERVAELPGIRDVAFGAHPPLSDGTPPLLPFTIEGRIAMGEDARSQSAIRLAVSSGYFRTLKAPVVQGREFRSADTAASAPVALINEVMARRFWPAESPLGRRILLDGADEPGREIVGVVGNLRHNRRANQAEMQIYLPNAQLRPLRNKIESETHLGRTFVVRAMDDPAALIPSIRAAVAAEDRSLPLFHIRSVDAYVGEQLWQPRQTMILLSAFSAIAVLVAIAGVFGIVDYMARQRTHEIGVRIALGAGASDVVWLVASRGFSLVTLGIGGGLIGSLALARLLRNLLWNVSETDPATYATSIALLVAGAAIACLLPAIEACRVDPLSALRSD